MTQMAKTKHNKKRNTAFLYEALVREMTKAVVSQDKQRKNNIVNILKESFSSNKILGKELKLYQAILESKNLNVVTAEKLLYKIREAYSELDSEEIYNAQSEVINKINKNQVPVFSKLEVFRRTCKIFSFCVLDKDEKVFVKNE